MICRDGAFLTVRRNLCLQAGSLDPFFLTLGTIIIRVLGAARFCFFFRRKLAGAHAALGLRIRYANLIRSVRAAAAKETPKFLHYVVPSFLFQNLHSQSGVGLMPAHLNSL